MNKKAVILGSLAHAVADGFQFVVPALIPFYILTMNISYAQAGLIWTLVSIASSVPQPFFGALTDRARYSVWVAVGLIVTSVFMAAAGLAQDYYLAVLIVVLGGIGIAVVHPAAAAAVAAAGGRRPGAATSFFVLGGNLGFAIAPLVLPPLLIWGGPQATLAVFPIGVLVAAAVLIGFGRTAPRIPARTLPSVKPHAVRMPIVILLAVTVMRAWVYMALITFLPTYMTSTGFSLEDGSRVLALMLILGSLGSLLGGIISDSVSPKLVTVASMLLCAFFLAAFFRSGGPLQFVFISLAGFFMLLQVPAVILMAQRVLPGREATASGLILGFSIGVGGLGVGITGWMADQFGLYTALSVLAVVALVSGLCMLPYREKAWHRPLESSPPRASD